MPATTPPLQRSKTPPPSYGTRDNGLTLVDIDTGTVPEWGFNIGSCQTWLRLILTVQFNIHESQAATMSKRFKGCGAALYTMPVEKWIKIFGEDVGIGIHARLLGYPSDRAEKPDRIDIWKMQRQNAEALKLR